MDIVKGQKNVQVPQLGGEDVRVDCLHFWPLK